MARKNTTITLVINAKNEELRIARCIRSVAGLVDEVIVGDMNSSDNTRDIAAKLGAKVISIPELGYVEPAREMLLSQVTSGWILLLDADEVVPARLKKTLQKIVDDDAYDVVRIPYKNMLFGKWIKHAWWWPDYHERFYRQGFVHWSKEIHTAPKIKGRVLTLPAKEVNAIKHENYTSVAQFIEKMNKYTRYSEGVEKHITSPQALMHYYQNEFSFRYVQQKGYQDGLHGFFLSKLMEFYRFVEVAKYWESKKFSNIVNPSTLFKVVTSDSDESEVTKLRQQVDDLHAELTHIKSAKFFKAWQFYCELRRRIVRYIS